MLGDVGRLMQVFSNLIGNSLKVVKPGDAIVVRAERRDSEISFSVADTGPGIPAAQLPRLFDPFWQASKTSRVGVGLGLSIVKAIVETHDGHISVESELGAGSTFSFSIPLADPESTERASKKRPGRRTGA